jgi:hypothetical protein
MLTTTARKGKQEVTVDVLDELKREGREEGERKGLAEGERKGLAEGERRGRARMLVDQLTVRFGPVPAEAKARILAAESAELTRWSRRVLTASTLEAVLEGESGKGAKKAAAPRRAGGRR